MSLNAQGRRISQRGENGYILLTLLLVITLMIIFAAAIVPSITFEIKRDREEEMIHRGVQYSRAIRAYYKKFGRYPTRIEELESSNNLRFLRKRYKDPITGQDFKLLHFGEAGLAMGAGIPGATPIAAAAGGLNGPGGLNGQGGLGQTSAFGGNSGFGNSTFGSGNGFGANANASFGQNQQATNAAATGTDGSQSTAAPGAANAEGPAVVEGNSSPADRSSPNQQVQTFGGGPIVGVASLSKKETIREFNHKKKYNEWQFIYDPSMDRGFLITTPYQPQMIAFGMQGLQNSNGSQNLNGQNGAGQPGNGFGSSTFGNSPGGMMQNNPNPMVPSGYGTPNPPNNPPNNQQ